VSDVETIGDRLREWGVGKYGSVGALAEALGIAQESASRYLKNKRRPGIALITKLKEIGADADWIMTGRRVPIEEDDEIIRFHGNPSDELRASAQRIVQMIVDNPGKDIALLERMARDILDEEK